MISGSIRKAVISFGDMSNCIDMFIRHVKYLDDGTAVLSYAHGRNSCRRTCAACRGVPAGPTRGRRRRGAVDGRGGTGPSGPSSSGGGRTGNRESDNPDSGSERCTVRSDSRAAPIGSTSQTQSVYEEDDYRDPPTASHPPDRRELGSELGCYEVPGEKLVSFSLPAIVEDATTRGVVYYSATGGFNDSRGACMMFLKREGHWEVVAYLWSWIT
jgi:hypothetical protein